MRTDRSMVVFGDEWGLHPSSTQHLAAGFARDNPVLYVNAVGMRRPRLNRRDMQRAFGKLRQWAPPVAPPNREHPPLMKLCSPIRIPLNSFRPIRRWNQKTLVRRVRQELQALGPQAPILFVSSPVGAEAVGALGEKLVLYYVTDDYAALPGVDREYVEDLDKVLLDHADLIFTTSTELQHLKKGRRTSPRLLPHGVNFEHFHSAAEPRGVIPEEMRDLPRPILGFYGLLAPWVDTELLRDVARAFPQGSVVIIGPAWSHSRPPEGISNLHWLGPKPYADLPRYAAHFDVGLMTFQQNRLTTSVNPLKFLEYLALGLPVVSTPLPELDHYAGMVTQATNSEAFIAQIQTALQEESPERRQQRFNLARRESWEARVEFVFEAIDQALTRKTGC